jgi:lysozyme family protein
MTAPSSRFMSAVAVVLKHEGDFSCDPDDPGGATNHGISLRFALMELAGDADGDGRVDGDFDRDGDIDADDIRTMSRDDAIAVYRHHWWDRYHYDQLGDDALATKVFDLAVNMGAKQAHLCLQRAIRAVWFPVAEDGVLGPKTMAAANAADPRLLLPALRAEAAGFYRTLITAKPRLEKYRSGWLRRAYS